jgi:hypothetical protein
MATLAPLTEDEVRQFVSEWYQKLDVHAPLEEVLPLLLSDGLEMRFPEGTYHSLEEFKAWYHAVTHRFFDEVHELKDVRITLEGDRAPLTLVVNWQAHIWDPPAAKSQWLGFDAAQTWVVQRSPSTHKPVIAFYGVDSLTPMEGSAGL